MTPRKILGLPSYRSCHVLYGPLQSSGLFEIRRDVPARIALLMREGDLQAALLSPVDFARESSDYQILPGVAVAFREGAGGVRLHFRKGVRKIATLAASPSSSAEIVLARIILAEEFESAPSIVPAEGVPGELLERADAVLVSDELSPDIVSPAGESLDIVEAWREMTDLPYVSGVWCCREAGLEDGEVAAIQRAHRDAEEHAMVAAAAALAGPTYALTSAVEEGLRSVWHYAFYHGILPDIPELRYYSAGAPGEAPDVSPLLN